MGTGILHAGLRMWLVMMVYQVFEVGKGMQRAKTPGFDTVKDRHCTAAGWKTELRAVTGQGFSTVRFEMFDWKNAYTKSIVRMKTPSAFWLLWDLWPKGLLVAFFCEKTALLYAAWGNSVNVEPLLGPQDQRFKAFKLDKWNFKV